MKYQFEIKLKSDLCASSGESMGSYIDNDICYDENGIPYIPSKRLKGLLRECAEEYCDWDNSFRDSIDKIFGIEGSRNPGALKIDNAYISEYETITEELSTVPQRFKPYLSKQKILNSYTYTRYQTAVDAKTGTSLKNTLRATRVVKKDNVFFADVEIHAEENSKEMKLFQNAIKLCQHMGRNRTRGYGEIVCRLKKKEETKANAISIDASDDTRCEIQVLLKAESEIMVAKQNTENSENYIPGSNILGNVAKRYLAENPIDFENMTDEYVSLFLNGDVTYSNAYYYRPAKRKENTGRPNENRQIAYITEEAGREFYPIPFSYATVKNSKHEYYNKMFDITKDNVQLSNITDQYVTLDGTDYLEEVKLTENYHHQRPKNKAIGHAIPKEDGGTLYQYTAIMKNQYFLTKIAGTAKNLKKIIKYLPIGETLRVGKSKSTEYGKLKIEDIKVAKVKEQEKTYQKFAVVLTSNVILMNQGQITISKDKFVDTLKDKLGGDIQEERAFINYEKVSGYNILWNLPKEQVESLKAGSVFVFTSPNGVRLKDEYAIGQRQNEGYGKIKMIDLEGKDARTSFEKSRGRKRK